MVHDYQLWRPVCQGREVMTPCISPLWTKPGVLQKLLANGLHISLVTLTRKSQNLQELYGKSYGEKLLPCIPNRGIKHMGTYVAEHPIKINYLTDYMKCETIDIAVVTETWLTNSGIDTIWIDSNGFAKDGYQISAVNRISKKGGGASLIHRSNITVIKVDQEQHRSFESAHWMTTIRNYTLNILALYHPPYSARQKITNTMFIDDLTNYLMDWMASYGNILISGDFNIHIDGSNDTEVQIFNDMMEALGLQQHVNLETYHAGNTLDLLFTEITSQLNTRTFKGRYISDHGAIVTELDRRIQHTNSSIVTFRNLNQIKV